jgi:D-3-phosphoglycerate dehydrogenase
MSEARFKVYRNGEPHRPDAPPDPYVAELEKRGFEMVRAPYNDEDELIAMARDADVVLEGGPRVTARVMDALPALKLVSAFGIGYNFTDVPAATERGIPVMNVPLVFHREVAHHAMTLLLSLNRHLLEANEVWRGRGEHGWDHIGHLYGETLGLIAFGNIARIMARIAHGFEMRVIAYDPLVPPEVFAEHQVEPVSLEDLFGQSDYISCHAPLNPETYHLITARHFALAKPHAVFVNTGRGPVVDETALIAALREGRIAAAGLDVFEKEPPEPDNPLLAMPNVIVTPHMAAESTRLKKLHPGVLAERVGMVLSGRWPEPGPVNSEVRAHVEAAWRTSQWRPKGEAPRLTPRR